jgi:hypothetical protein
MTVTSLDQAAEDAVQIGISVLRDLLPPGQVSNNRRSGAPLPFILVAYVGGVENEEESCVDDVIAVDYLSAFNNGDAAALQASIYGMDVIHRRMLGLARYLEDVPLPGGRIATISHCKVFKRPSQEPYGDDQIIRRCGQYQFGLDYV